MSPNLTCFRCAHPCRYLWLVCYLSLWLTLSRVQQPIQEITTSLHTGTGRHILWCTVSRLPVTDGCLLAVREIRGHTSRRLICRVSWDNRRCIAMIYICKPKQQLILVPRSDDAQRYRIPLPLRSDLQNESRWWREFCKYVKQSKGNGENIPAIKGRNGKLITDPTEKAQSLNSYYESLLRCKRNNPQIHVNPSPLVLTL
jgi:hypothetical protein